MTKWVNESRYVRTRPTWVLDGSGLVGLIYIFENSTLKQIHVNVQGQLRISLLNLITFLLSPKNIVFGS